MGTKYLPEDAMVCPIMGVNLEGRNLGEEIGNDPTLLVFLRHLG